MTNIITSLLKQETITPLITINGTFTTEEKLSKQAKKEYMTLLKEDRLSANISLSEYTKGYIEVNTIPVSKFIEQVREILLPDDLKESKETEEKGWHFKSAPLL